MNDYPECDSLKGRMRSICRNEAGLPLCGTNSTNAYRTHWGMDELPGDCEPETPQQARSVLATGVAVNHTPPTQATPSQLVGDVMTALIKEYGLAAKSSCSCKSWAGKMNEWGVAGCREHRAEIIAHLGEAYHAATWWDTFKAAGSAVYHSLPLTLGGMVDEAIRRTENPWGN